MAIPKVDVTINQNSLGLQDPSSGDALAIVGPASSGPTINNVADAFNVPLLYGSVNAAKTDYVSGALVEAAAMGLEVTGRPVVLVRTEATTPGAITNIDNDNVTGTAVPVAASTASPDDELEPYVIFRVDGIVGTTGITYQTSLDGGRHLGPLTALGALTRIDLGHGVIFDLEPDETEFVAFVVNLRTKSLAHLAYTSGSVHLAADTTSDDGIGSAPTNWATGITRLNEIRAALILHATNNTAHTADDTVSFAALPAAATTKHEAVSLAIAIDTAFAAHLAKLDSVHGAADTTNVLSVDPPTHGTIAAGDFFTARTTMPASTEAEIDAALAALQTAGYTYKTVLILPPILTTSNANAIGTRFNAMKGAYRYKKLFGAFRVPNVAETESAYLAAFKGQFDAVTCFGLYLAAGAVEFQSSASRPATYKRPPSWLAAATHVVRGPRTSIAYVENGLGALPLGASIVDANGNPKHHDEAIDEGLDAARAMVLRSHAGYPGKCFYVRGRSLAQLGTDFMFLHFWAAMIEVLDVAVPHLIGQIQGEIVPDVETGRIDSAFAREIEKGAEEAIDAKVIAKGIVRSATVSIDRTVNVFSSPQLPVEISVVPYPVNEGFKLVVGLNNPQYSNA